MGIPCEGKSIFPLIGEFDPRVVRESAIEAGLLPESAHVPLPEVDVGPLPARPPVLCPGCPHRGVFYVLSKLKVPVNGDIGCYTLGLLPPLSAMHTCGCMGAGIGVAHGAAKAGSPERHVAVIGDSTFFHTGMPALLNVGLQPEPGHHHHHGQPHHRHDRPPGEPRHRPHPAGQEPPAMELEPLVRALGVKHVRTVPAYDVDEVEDDAEGISEAGRAGRADHRGAVRAAARGAQALGAAGSAGDKCNGCTLCFRVGCPAILKSDELDEKTQRPKALIDASLCTGCEVCAQMCPRTIKFR